MHTREGDLGSHSWTGMPTAEQKNNISAFITTTCVLCVSLHNYLVQSHTPVKTRYQRHSGSVVMSVLTLLEDHWTCTHCLLKEQMFWTLCLLQLHIQITEAV